jgi:predicted  nucleic acid-binding Zn-ribbon protein
MDVIRSNDEARLTTALSSNGWTKTVEDEGWHWEATDAASYVALETHITNVMEAISRTWALTLSSFYERRKDRIRLMAELEEAMRELNTLQREVDDIRRNLSTENDRLAEEANKLKQLYNDILTTDQLIIDLQRHRANMRYTRCPNKNTYETCTHNDLKAQYDEELRQLDLAIEQSRERRKGLARDYDDRRRRLQTARAQYAQKEARWRARNQALAPARRNAIAKRAAITKSERQMQQARNSSTLQLRDIVARVNAWG